MTRYNISSPVSPYATIEYKNIVLTEMMAKIHKNGSLHTKWLFALIMFLKTHDKKTYDIYNKMYVDCYMKHSNASSKPSS